MDLFARHGRDVELLRPSEGLEPLATFRALFDRGKAHAAGDTIDVRNGDVLRSTLPNGNVEHWAVRDVITYSGGPLANTEILIERCPPPRALPAQPSAVMGHVDDETWTRRDLPVLRAALQLHETDPSSPEIAPEAIAQLTGFENGAVQVAIRALESDGLLIGVRRGASDDAWLIDGVSGEGRRRVGAWPSPEGAVLSLINYLQDVANDPDRREEERSTARRILEAVGSFSTDVGANLLGGLFAHMLGA